MNIGRLREIIAVEVMLVAVSGMFFYKLGQSSLVSWDEAWYAEIGKQILQSGNLWVMHFNQTVFVDHPPVGFWLNALGQKIWGVNEFGSRVMSAIFGLGGMVGTYLLGKKWYGTTVGWTAAWALASTPWYLYRARTGNLDIFLTTFVIWTFYLAERARSDRRYFWIFLISGTLTLLTKTMLPLTMIPALGLVFWGSRITRIRDWVVGLVGVGVVVGKWINANIALGIDITARYLSIGLPGVGVGSGVVIRGGNRLPIRQGSIMRRSSLSLQNDY